MTTTLENKYLQLEVAHQAGASLVGLRLRMANEWVPLTRPTPPEAIETGNPSLMASFTMAPWCNRIQDGRFDFLGKPVVLRINTTDGYAQHGDVRKRPWQIVEQTASKLVCTIDSRQFDDFNFPFLMQAKVEYALDGNRFITRFWLSNLGTEAMPGGFGFHPYFNRTFGNRGEDEAQVQFNVTGLYPPMPSGAVLPIPAEHDFSTLTPLGQRVIDAVYNGWDGKATIRYPKANVRMDFTCDETLRHLCFFTPAGKPFFAVEPLSHGLNGPNLFAMGHTETGIRVVQPNETMTGEFVITVR